MNKTKVLGIGLNKTGTKTLRQCGELLGYRNKSCSRYLLKQVVKRNDLSGVYEAFSQYDMFDDWPWPLVYRQIDERYPGTKFVLTVRENEHVWFESLKKHAMQSKPLKHCRKFAYGFNYPHRHEMEFKEFYLRHNQEARDCFQGRKQDFLEICWENGDGIEDLCEFLAVPYRGYITPHTNKYSDRKFSKFRYMVNKIVMMTGL